MKEQKEQEFENVWQAWINIGRSAIVEELRTALNKYPSFNSGHEGYAIIKEELDELWEIVKLKQSTPNRNELMEKEAIQVAAMAIRFLLDLDQFKN